MRILKPMCLVLLAIGIFTACKKDKDDKPTIVGLWKGKYGGTTNYPHISYAILFRSNGTVRVFDGTDTTTAQKAEGTYTVTGGSTVNTTYSYPPAIQYSTTATINTGMTFMEGTYGTGTNTTNGGRFFVVKE
jgi:hypothetical protein